MPNYTLVFLPGWGFKASVFESFTDYLTLNLTLKKPYKKNHYHFKLINFPELSPAYYNNADLLALIIQNLHAQISDCAEADPIFKSCKKLILIGWSLGGLLAVYLAHRFPDQYKKLILISALPKFVSDNHWTGISEKNALNFYARAKSDIHKARRYFLGLVQYPEIHTPAVRQYFEKHLLDYAHNLNNLSSLSLYLDLLLSLDLRKIYQQLSMPVIHISGGKDAIVPLQAIQQLKKPMRSYIIPEAGHAAFLTHPNIFTAYFQQALFT